MTYVMVPVPEDQVEEIRGLVMGLTLRAEGSDDPRVAQFLADSRFVASLDEQDPALVSDDEDLPSVDEW